MANRLALPRPSLPLGQWRRAAGATRELLPHPSRDAIRLALYRVAWGPFWLGSDLPAPVLPQHEATLPAGGLAGDHLVRHLARIARRVWLLRALSILMRAIWLPILVGCGWLALELLGGPALRPHALLWIGAALLVPAVVFAVLEKPTKREIARMLDRSFGLQDRMVTAYDYLGHDVPAPGETVRVGYLQTADAANVITELRGHPAFRIRPPVREIVLGIACALLLAALFFMRGVGGGLPVVADGSVPAFVRAADRMAKAEQQAQPPADAALTDAPTVAQVTETAAKSNQTQQDLKKIGDAMANQATTRDASEAIQAGDYAKAADLIRQAGENADQLSDAARNSLADELDAAANEIADSNPDLAKAAHDAADGLRQGGQAAKDGMTELGDAVDRAADDIVSQPELASQMKQAEAADAQRAQNGQQGSDASDSSNPPGDQASSDSGSNPSASDSSASSSDSSAGEQGSQSSQQNGQSKQGSGDTGQGNGQPGGDPQPGDQQGDNGNPGSNAGYGQVKSQSGVTSDGEGAQPGKGDAQNGGNANSTEDQTSDKQGDNGTGAGSGEGNGQQSQANGTNGANQGKTTGGEQPGDPNVTDPTGGGDKTDAIDPHDAVTLPTSADTPGVQTQGNGDNSSKGQGGGNGASVNPGASVQGEVGDAGPDSNRVPPEYRSVVEDYFSEDGS